MTPLAIKLGHIRPRHIDLLNQVKQIVDEYPNTNSHEITCHEICEHITKIIPELVWVKGKFDKIWDHSWLEIPQDRIIIDAYPWASHIPFLVYNGMSTPWARLYQEKGPPWHSNCHKTQKPN